MIGWESLEEQTIRSIYLKCEQDRRSCISRHRQTVKTVQSLAPTKTIITLAMCSVSDSGSGEVQAAQ